MRRRRRGRARWSWAVVVMLGLAGLAALREPSSSQPGAPSQTQDPAAPRADARTGRRAPREKPAGLRIPASSPFHSPAACEAHLRARPQHAARGPRIGTWNVRWFPYGSANRKERAQQTDVDWLACAIASLDVDLLAVQEFVQDPGGRRALRELTARLDTLTGGSWQAQLDDCSGNGFQHVGFLFDGRRVELRSPRTLAAFNPGRGPCDRSLRPGLGAYARFGGRGPDLHVVALHLDSGTDERDFTNRTRSLSALPRVLADLPRVEPDTDLLLLGDFNTMGCKECAPRVAAPVELEHVDAQLRALGLRRIAAPAQQTCSHYYRGKAGLFDHIVARSDMDELAHGVVLETHGPCRHLACGPAAVGEDIHAWQYLSDHCPVVIELAARDGDP